MLSTVLVYINFGFFAAFENVYTFIVGKRNIELVFNVATKVLYTVIFFL